MTINAAVIVLFIVALLAANMPWLSERRFFVLPAGESKKSAWLCLAEWLLAYVLVFVLAVGLERNINGELHSQSWEFWPVTLLLFVVFAMPGFIWRYDMQRYLKRYQKQTEQMKKN